MRTNGASPSGGVNASAEQSKMMALARAHLVAAAAAATTSTFAVPTAPAPSGRLLPPGTVGFGLPTRPTPPSSMLPLGTAAAGRPGIPVAGASGLVQPRMVQQMALGNGARPLSALNGQLASHSSAVSALAQYRKPAPVGVAVARAVASSEAAPVAWDDECY